ncbi:MAG TPA: DUF1508 domain-containing protein [Solirubrobacterales bacterium]|nr:DUF1508 domain-containing protein [Solirubrobacterales bacterium]
MENKQMSASSPYYKIKSASGGYRAYFYGANGTLVWWTEVYSRKQGAEEAITFARNWAASAPVAS